MLRHKKIYAPGGIHIARPEIPEESDDTDDEEQDETYLEACTPSNEAETNIMPNIEDIFQWFSDVCSPDRCSPIHTITSVYC